MENNTYKSDDLTENVLTQILELFCTYKLVEEEAQLKAICYNVLIHNTKSANGQNINLGIEFYNLEANEKLIAIKYAITTHFQVTKGELVTHGKTLCYQLHDKTETYRLFNLAGELILLFKSKQ